MGRSVYDLTRENNAAVKEVIDALVELNAHKFEAEQQGWSVKFIVQNGDVDVTISRDSWPHRQDEEPGQ